MNKKLRNFLTITLFVKDIKCLFCGRELDKSSRYCVCDDCFNKLQFINGKICKKCGEPIESLAEYCLRCKNHVDRGFDKARAQFLYSDEIAKAVRDLKYHNKKYLAEYLSNFLYDLYMKENFAADVIIPAPMSEKSLKSRGFNQCELLCGSFSEHGLTVNANCIIKFKETQNQVQLNYADRQKNLIGAFKVVDKSAVKNKNIVLIDDIFTTGATATEICETLKKSGAKRVDVLTLCHEMPENAAN